ncbi:MAG: phosphate signaling complex protein PhoU [Rudaea sp.]|jgi:phosphate transport system protein|uniref:phosphate signaling complex protein PhoU n=1 Tax=unclassified Rudaea TaxID=2627037 RepID=UPI0010F5B4C9|nr:MULTISPECIES: phosphate signaling complex protein PhoU [unclassified Rudaea]MBN8886279.1 phosphate signaling complex protein PhoU [Rudaea sp.]MBR0346605.1 phosphate signaling complex protein PhoU [Rudaea sp.]
MSEHIVKSFDDELSQLNAAIARMGELTQSQFATTMNALRTRDVEDAAMVIRDDIDVDALERDIESRAIRVLALRQPIARDFREVISTLRIVVELERISDFSANICKRVIALNSHSPEQWLVEIGELGELAKKQLADVVTAFTERNQEKAITVWACDEQIDDTYTGISRRLIDYMKADPQHVAIGAHLMFIAKNVERIGDHVTNIAESIYYLVTGNILDAPRPKGDKTSLDQVEAEA